MRGSSEARATSRRQVSYRLSLLVMVSLLVATSGGLIIANTAVTMRRAVRALTARIFSETTRRSLVNSRNRVQTALPAIETLASGIEREPGVAKDRDAIANRLLDVARANPAFVRVSFSGAEGSFTSALRVSPEKLLLNESTIHDGRSELFEYVALPSGARELARHEDDDHHDPRRSGFYKLAVERHRRVWTAPRVVGENHRPGVTCARPVYAGEGALVGVLTVEFDLTELSDYLAHRRLSPRGRLFAFDADGVMVAAARVGVLRHREGAPDEIATTETIDDPLIHAYYAAAVARGVHTARTGGDDNQELEFQFEGERWIGAFDPFEVDEGTRWVVAAAAPASDFTAEVARSNRESLAISLASLVVAVILSGLFATRMSRRLTALAGEMAEVGRFRLQAGSAAKPSVLLEFSMMNRALEAMKQSLRSFANFVPADLVRTLLESGQEAKLGGQLRPMTAFFSDIAGFTSVAEEMEPGPLVELLGQYLQGLTQEIARERGTVDKFIGDGIMAFWGAPEPLADHAARACRAAVLCQRRLAELQRTGPLGMKKLSTRIGVASGDVLVGNIGTPERMNYTIMGDTVNLASRLEGLNKQYGTRIMASEAAVRAAGGRVLARPIDVVAVKGKARGVKVYELMALEEDDDKVAVKVAADSERALEAYLARDFDVAARAWSDVLAERPGDPVATLMRDRARAYETAPPPVTWNGVHVTHEK